jgi:hypothetical protein
VRKRIESVRKMQGVKKFRAGNATEQMCCAAHNLTLFLSLITEAIENLLLVVRGRSVHERYM